MPPVPRTLASQTATSLRLISVPAGHPYPRALRADSTSSLVVAPDPDPRDPGRPAQGVWWPHAGLEPAWLGRQDFDVLHLHFGFDHRTPRQLSELVDHLGEARRPLVLTIHDLRNPHHDDPGTLDRQLDVLVPAAETVLTLTPWAADQIRDRWQRDAVVSRHPHLVPVAAMRRLRRARRTAARRRRTPVVAVSCKSLRANCDPVRLLPALGHAVERHGARLRVLMHQRTVGAADAGRHRDLATALETAQGRGAEVVVHEPLDDPALWRELADQDVAVLPYRFGTHSGWLELCHDVGTHVLAPAFGGYADQGADGLYAADEHDVDEESLIESVGVLVERVRSGALAGAGPEVRSRQRRAAADVHERVYRRALAAGAA